MQSIQQILESKPESICYGSPAKKVQNSSTLTTMPKSQQNNQTTSSSSKEAALYERVIDTLFIRFAAIYGHAWSSLHKEGKLIEMFKREWADALRKFDKTIIRDALIYCRSRYRLPPTLPEFIDCCKSFQSRSQTTPLPSQEELFVRNVETSQQFLTQIKNILQSK